MVAICLPFRGHDVSLSPGYNINNPQHQDQQQSQPHANPWVKVLEDDRIVVTCCRDGSPYHKLICGHLIYTLSRGCGRTCRVAVNSTEELRTEFNCDRCVDEQTFADIMEQIRQFWSTAILENRIILLEHLQPYIDAFEYQLTLGRRTGIGRRGRKAFAKTNEELVENFQIQIENLIERSCRYFLNLLVNKRGSEMYDEPGDDNGWEDDEEELGEQLLDDTEEGEVVEDDLAEDMGEGEDANILDLAANLSIRPHPRSAAGVEHKLSVVESLVGCVDLGDSFGSVKEAMEAEEIRMATYEESPVKRDRGDGSEFLEEQDDIVLASPSKKACLARL